MQQYVFDFAEGNTRDKELLGGKGANLAEMTRLGLPVPPGFTIATTACRHYLTTGREPDGLAQQVGAHLADLQERTGKRLGDPEDPLLVSVRSGAKFSMPGMMDTVLNVGLNDMSVVGLAARSGDERFAWDSYRRLVQMFGKTVLGIDDGRFDESLEACKKSRRVDSDVDLDAADLRGLVDEFKHIVYTETGRDFPQDPRQQLDLAIRAVFDSWNTERARLYRRQERIPDDLGTAVNVCTMVFGNLGPDSGTGVAFTRDPATGAQGVYGDYLPNAQGEDVVAGIRNTLSLAELERIDKASYDQLLDIMATLERHYLDLCDIEFTIERGKLWMLQTRVGKRTAAAAFRIAAQLASEGLIDDDEMLSRVRGEQLAQLMFPQFDPAAPREVVAGGMAASPGAAVGKAAFDSATAVAWARDGEDVILVRRETNPDDLGGMVAARGVLTSRGGKTSHAAVVARGMGRTCVTGVEALRVDPGRKEFTTPDGTRVKEGDVISIDGGTGEVFLGEVPVVPSAVVDALHEVTDDGVTEDGVRTTEDGDDVVSAVLRVMRQADRRRRLDVRANADTPDDAARARSLGACGIGLCRTEHMFLGPRRRIVERLILARDDDTRQAALDELRPLQRADFTDILAAMDGLPVTIRLLDPPLHEFLPDLTDLSVRVAVAEATGEPDAAAAELLSEVQRLHEQNPMLGMRGVRLGLVIPELFTLQVRAIAEAAAELRQQGREPRPEIMVPLVAAVQELEAVRDLAGETIAQVSKETGVELTIPVGTMIELPRSAMTAHQIAEAAEFFSFGTNDLTQTTWGFSRDDVEATFFPTYLESGVFGVSPFESIDTEGVGRLVSIAAWEGKETRPDLKVGICGEHGGDPASIHFFESILLDYVSCSPFRVPVARLEAARASVAGSGPDGSSGTGASAGPGGSAGATASRDA
ncbi:pyruvate, phosphate dikinase [Actinobacteria bacterium YIM 96077]|uniref:Pyruvate, phosphate dikinase n=1 Tax=Phytoactinopolyspora halophila TaxID=1981511 RepID=A0A329QKC2_9ACTN|nr:pyruvate, phosphate dikinase [Phytoactinopolyspora halophila]AYY14051.1 pyruvate, phosphate dikinase [Actinobacteria bacterium YIM 96077]RAW10958.1 pyruvate, phosphate dikinase [Phytoactinopolyspora halophila]